MSSIKKVIIIGGGPAGLLAALRLHETNLITPIIYEIHPKPTTLGGSVGIPPNGLRLLARLGLYEAILAKGAETEDMVLHSLRGEDLGEMSMVSWSKRDTGFGYVRVRRTDLIDVLLHAIEQRGIPLHCGKHLVAIEDTVYNVAVSFSDGTYDRAEILLGCDGIHSSVRRLYVDPGCDSEYTGISNMYSLISASALPPAASKINGLNATLTTDGLFAVSPTSPTGDLYWFFSREISIPGMGEACDGWEERGKQETESWKATLLELFGLSEQSNDAKQYVIEKAHKSPRHTKGEWMGVLQEIVEKTESVKFYPTYKVPTGRPWSKGRCLLIGDAAHAMPPHASQGVSMALEDVFLLSKLLERSWGHIEDGFKLYEQKRKARTEEMLKSAEHNANARRKVGPWGLWATEKALSGTLWAHKVLGLDGVGMHHKSLVYDVEEEEFS